MTDATPASGFDLLEPVDLRERIRLAQGALVGCLDASRGYLPYWNCDIADGNLTVAERPAAVPAEQGPGGQSRQRDPVRSVR